MYAGGPNPTQVQFLPPGAGARTPLVLVHDGGGTTFSYFLLGSLGRDVWAVHDGRYFGGGAWEGGVDEMAGVYLRGLVGEGIRGGIVLGGWSLGGFIALKMAHLLARNPDAYPLSVVGILLIDSPYHAARRRVTQPFAGPPLGNVPELVRKSFERCDLMLYSWELPRWRVGGDGNGAEEAKKLAFTAGGREFALRPCEVLYKSATGGARTWETVSVGAAEPKTEKETGKEAEKQTEMEKETGKETGKETEKETGKETEKETGKETEKETGKEAEADADVAPGRPPPAVLIRCTKPAGAHPEGAGAPCLVDLHRDERLLGWEGRYPDFIRAVIDVDADHYGLFDRMDAERLRDVTARVGWGLEVLEGVARGRGRA